MFSRPKILFLVSLLFVALLNSIPIYLLNFEFFYQSYLLRWLMRGQCRHPSLVDPKSSPWILYNSRPERLCELKYHNF